MSESTVDGRVVLCLDCNYALRGLPENRCPECGRAFDPDDPDTMNLGRAVGPWIARVLKPTGWPTITAAALSASLMIIAASPPGAYFLLLILALYAWFAVAAWWIVRLLIYVGVAFRYRQPGLRDRRTWRRWIAAPLIGALTFWTVYLDVPLRAAFWISRPWMQALAAQVVDRPENVPERRWVGVFPIGNIERFDDGVRFLVRGSGFMDMYGFAFETSGNLQSDSLDDRYDPLFGRWHVWRRNW